ncbi:MAG: hypothetical protein Q9195_003519 [Heterodermia aff. obscurata]
MLENRLPFRSVLIVTVLALTLATATARPTTPVRGLQIIPGTCTGEDLVSAQNAILDASYLAGAGRYAAAKFVDPPFNMFFDATMQNGFDVAQVYQRILAAQQGKGNRISVFCQDIYNRCNSSQNQTDVVPAYSVQTPEKHRAPQIILCAQGLALPRDLEPCTDYPGGISLGWLMVHVMTGLSLISGSHPPINDLEIDTARKVMQRVVIGQDTMADANAYSYLGTWAWALGMGGPPWDRRRMCLDNAQKGYFDEMIWPDVHD